MLEKRLVSPEKDVMSSNEFVKRVRKENEYNKSNSNIKVCVRVRPFNSREKLRKQPNLVEMDEAGKMTQLRAPDGGIEQLEVLGTSSRRNSVVSSKRFTFDHSFWSFDGQDVHFVGQNRLYAIVGKEFLQHTMDGYNTCMFAYGQTGSGKSYTMMGDDSEPGLIPRVCEQLFQQVDHLLREQQTVVTVKVSYFEIYNEYVYDLLNPGVGSVQDTKHGPRNTLEKLRVRESPETGPYVENLAEFPVKSYSEVCKHFAAGNANRKTAATKMNVSSSRSHAIFTILVKQTEYSDIVTGKVLATRKSTLRLIDLAGSERASASGAIGQRLKEGSNINRSLVCLGRVINALASASGSKDKVVPYRDSVLTWILKESLGGNSKTTMIACISPCDYDETLSTLRYANNAKKIRTEAVVNQDQQKPPELSATLATMQSKISRLETELQARPAAENEKEKTLIRATQTKISNNYKRYLKYYEEKLIEEETKNKIIVNEINKLRAENSQLRISINSIINPILHDNLEQDNLEQDKQLGKPQTIKSPIKLLDTNTLSPKRLLPSKINQQPNVSPSPISTNSPQSRTNALLPKPKKLNQVLDNLSQLETEFKKAQKTIQDDLQRFNPAGKLALFDNDE